jgi:DNA polymerase-3 subunit alpha
VPRLQASLLGYRGGQTPLRLSYGCGAGRAEIELGADWRVRAGPNLLRALERLPGVLAAELVLTRAGTAN